MSSFKRDIEPLLQLQLTGNGIQIGHLDTGVDGAHTGLEGRVAAFRRIGYRAMSSEAGPAWDSGWHGTHIASIVVDIAPAARFCSAMVIEEGDVLARILVGLDWLLTCNVGVVLLSLGIFTENPILRSMIQEMTRRNILVVSVSGNRGAGQALIPGIYPEVLTVGAANANGRIPPFSGSYHPDGTERCAKPDLIAPGVDVWGALPGEGWATRSGTSMAAAHVAGLAALLKEAFPTAPAAVLKTALLASSAAVGEDQAHRAVNGLVRPLAAYRWLTEWANGWNYDHQEVSIPIIERTLTPYLDQHLVNQLNLAGRGGICQAILEFESWKALREVQVTLARARLIDNGVCEVKMFNHRPILIIKGPKPIVKPLVKSEGIIIASACDIDKWHFPADP